MSRTQHIDNDDPFFDFDSYEPLQPLSLLEESARGTQTPRISTGSPSPTPLYIQDDPPSNIMSDATQSDVKGKRVSYSALSEPMSIPLAGSIDREDDFFASLAGQSSTSTTSFILPVSQCTIPQDSFGIMEVPRDDQSTGPDTTDGGKGKGRELPPTLPPLSFSPTEFSYASSDWPAGPSSYSSSYASAGDIEPRSLSSPLAEQHPPITPDTPASPAPIPLSRRRTTSNISKYSRHSISAPTLSKVKVKFAGSKAASGTLARKLLFRKSPPTSPRPASANFEQNDVQGSSLSPALADLGYVGQNSCLIPWSREIKSRSPLASPVVETNSVWGVVDSPPTGRVPRLVDPLPMRTKGRSYSSPLPFQTSAFDIVPLAPADLYEPPPPVLTNHFDEYLPHELKLQVLTALVDLHIIEHEKRIRDGKWTVLKASSSKSKWVGKERGFRELFKLSRVSKSWRELVFDGQLWVAMELCSFPKLSSSVLLRLIETTGGFVRTLDFTGYTGLLPDMLSNIAHSLGVHPTSTSASDQTYLTSINLQGCRYISSYSLHNVLTRSPLLQRLCLKGQATVTNATCIDLATYCPHLIYLDLSRCPNMDGEGIRAAAMIAVTRGEQMALKDLRLTGLKRVTDSMMSALGKAAPYLEVLDLGYCKDLHNSAIDAFTSCTEEEAARYEAISLTSREAGRNLADSNRHWRRVTRLRHLVLSACILLTDHACSHLAHAVPKLEFLELAGIGPELHDNGLVRLLNTTPYIRKLDLEDATEVTDDVLLALTPTAPTSVPPGRSRTPPPDPGHALEHLILSYANVESETLSDLVRACTRLRVLEADNTRMTGLVLKEFVHLARERKVTGARVVAVDCRSVGEYVVKELSGYTRPRMGWLSWHARKLAYLDGRDREELGVGQDECDSSRVVVKTFYSWQTVDAVKAAREKKRRSTTRRGLNVSGSSRQSEEVIITSSGRTTRWWSPGNRRGSSAPATPTLDLNTDRGEGCTIM